ISASIRIQADQCLDNYAGLMGPAAPGTSPQLLSLGLASPPWAAPVLEKTFALSFWIEGECLAQQALEFLQEWIPRIE
ncbi:MAG TPA: hypothetical protein VI729_03355, partial [Anaerolineales bacterium]|nr:hypothetical protein [Anaerolineales bacterium]